MTEKEICAKPCLVYSRVVGYYRPVQDWNRGKKQEFADRLEFDHRNCGCDTKKTRKTTDH